MKIMLLTDDAIFSDVLAIAVENILEETFVHFDSLVKAEDFLGAEKDVSMVVLDSREPYPQLKRILEERQISCVRLVDDGESMIPSTFANHFVIKKPAQLQDIVALITEANRPKTTPSAYHPVKLKSLLLTSDSNDFDIFVKLSDSKYVCIVKRGDHFDAETFARFEARKLTHLYVKNEDFDFYVDNLVTKLGNISIGNPQISTAATATTLSQMSEMIRGSLTEVGLTPQMQKLAKVSVDLAVSAVKGNPRLNELLAAILENDSDYIGWHSSTLSFISCKLATMLNMDSQIVHFKLALASLLHDITVTNHEWARAGTQGEMVKFGIPTEKQEEYKKHPLQAAELARTLADFPGDADVIIAQHHEHPESSGFPLGVGHSRISPLSAIFIIAHEFTKQLYDNHQATDLYAFLERMQETHNWGAFKTILADLKKSMIESSN